MKTKKFLPIVMLVLALASCTSKDEKKATDVKEELPIVEVTTVTQENVKQNSEYTGTVEAFKTNNISSNSGSRIKQILVMLAMAGCFLRKPMSRRRWISWRQITGRCTTTNRFRSRRSGTS